MGKQTEKPTPEDIGAAMMAWYAESIREYPEGLVTQAQAAQMLNISRMATSRLVGRGYLRAVYFPEPPPISGVAIGPDDSLWLKVLGWMGYREDFSFPKACYVSFADVMELWKSGEAQEKCKRDWNIIMARLTLPTDRRMRATWDEIGKTKQRYQKNADMEREYKRLKAKEEGGEEK